MYFIDLTETYLQRPTNLGLPINSEDDDICFNVTTDGKHGYFAGKSTEWPGVGGTTSSPLNFIPPHSPKR